MRTKLAYLVCVVLAVCLATSSVQGKVLLQDDFEGEALNLDLWQLVNGPDVMILQGGGQVFFNRPVDQINYLVTAEQFDPAVTPLIISGSVTLALNGDMDIWTRASLTANTGGGPGHVLDSGIRINFWQDAVDAGWPPNLDILEKTAGVWPWDGSISDDANITGDDEAVDWDFVITDNGETITATYTQTSDPNNTLTVTGTSTTDFETDYIAFTVTNGFLNEVTITDQIPAKKIVWVSFHEGDDMPHADAAAAGFTEAPDAPYTQMLADAGYDVTRFITTGTPDVNVLEAADLVIISRSVNSGDYANDAATIWNNVRTPMIITGGYVLRNSRMGYTTGGTMPDTTGDIKLTVSDPNHPIFEGVAMTDGVMDNPFAGVVVYPTDGTTVARGISINTDPVNEYGNVLGTIADTTDPNDPNAVNPGPVGGMVIGEWSMGAELTHNGGAGTDILAGPRLVFLTGSRETSGISSRTAGLYDLYEDGAQMMLNAVAYMLVPKPIVENGSFELPGTDKFKAWDGEKDGESGEPATDIPGWSSDSTPVDSGVETGFGATDGEWSAFLKGADPSVWQLTSLILRADDVVELKVDAKNNWQAATLRLSMYVEVLGMRLEMAAVDVDVTDEMQEFSLPFTIQDQPMAVGMPLGIELDNVSTEGESWIGLDNVRVELVK